METPSRLSEHMNKTAKQIAVDCGLSEDQTGTLQRALEDPCFVSTPMEEHLADVIGALYRRIEVLEDERAALEPVTVGEHIITATKESTGYLINIQQANAEFPTFVAEVLFEVFDGVAGVYIYNELDEAPTQTIRL